MNAASHARPSLRWVLGALLALGVLWIYRQVPEFAFVAFDDDRNIVFNPHLGPLSWERVVWAFTDWTYVRRCIPLGWLGFAAVYGWSGLDASGWHLINLTLHLGGALMLWSILRRLARGPSGTTLLTGWAEAAVFAGAAFWAWHPLRAETVGWASGLLYGQAHVFLFGAVWLWLRAVEGGLWRAGAAALYAASLLTYPIALGAVPVFALLARWRGLGWGEAVKGVVPVMLIAGGVAAANVAAQAWLSEAARFSPPPTLAQFPASERLIQAGAVWAHYLWRSVWPWNLTPVDTVLLDHGPRGAFLIASAALWAALGLVCCAWPRVRGYAGAFFIAYACVLVPMLGLTQRPHFPSDRYAALPQAVLAAALMLALLKLRPGRGRSRVLMVVGALLIGGAELSRHQVEIWRDSDRLWSHIATRLGPGMPSSYFDTAYARWLATDGREIEAAARIDAALVRLPDNAILLAARAQVAAVAEQTLVVKESLGLKQSPPAAALLHFEIAREQSRRGDYETSAAHLREIRRIAPEYYARITGAKAPPAR